MQLERMLSEHNLEYLAVVKFVFVEAKCCEGAWTYFL